MNPFEPFPDPAWRVAEPDEASGRELDIESNLTVANGRIGVRGSTFLRHPDRQTCRRTYVAGLYTRPATAPFTPFLASLPQTAGVTLTVNDHHVPGVSGPGEDRTLDLRRGVLHASLSADRAPVEMQAWRFASQDRRELCVEAIRLTCMRDAILALVLADDHPAPELIGVRGRDGTTLWRGRPGGRALTVASTASVTVDGKTIPPTRRRDGALVWRWSAVAGQPAHYERRLAVGRMARLSPLSPFGVLEAQDLLLEHRQAWRRLWRDCDIRIEGDDDAEAALRFAAYHLNSAIDPTDPGVSVGARGLTGDGYRGHVFWDTEIYMLPFYAMTRPEAARTLLEYRHRTLPAARAKARRAGWRGALYAWESADTGEETTPPFAMTSTGPVPIPTGQREQHISADIAYAVWMYWTATGDDAFMWTSGAEILLETARFWASRAVPEADGKCHIRGVEGPDEYHEWVDDNAFTNGMAALNLRRAAQMAATLRAQNAAAWTLLSNRLDLTDAELGAWTSIAPALEQTLTLRDGVLEQFAGFFALDDLVAAGAGGLPRSIGVLLGRERRAESQVIKQADVVALTALRPEMLSKEQALASLRYYEARCDHDSSLSPALHALVAARLGALDTALAYFHETAAIDRIDVEVSSGAGVHMAAQGGLWQAAILGFGGLSFDEVRLSFDPRLPSGWRCMAFPVRWRDRRLKIVIDAVRSSFKAILVCGPPTVIHVQGTAYPLTQGRRGQVVVQLS